MLVAVVGLLLLSVAAVAAWFLLLRPDDEGFALSADPGRLEGVAGTEIFTTVTAENADDLVRFDISVDADDKFRPQVAEAFVAGELGVAIRPQFEDAGEGTVSLTVVGCRDAEAEECPEGAQERATIDIPVVVAEPSADEIPAELSYALEGRIEDQDSYSVVRDELVVILESDLSEEEGRGLITRIADESGGVVTGADPSTGLYQIAFPESTFAETKSHLDEIGAVDGVEEAVIEPLVEAPSSVRSDLGAGARRRGNEGHRDWQHLVVNDTEVQGEGSPDVRVAIIDTGIYFDHQDLDENVVSHRTYGGSLFNANMDHGTHVSGLACGDGSEEISGVAGICGLATYDIGPVLRVGTPRQTLSTIAIYRAMIDAARDGADVINMSLGSGPYNQDPCLKSVPSSWSEALEANQAISRNAFRVVRREVGRGIDREPLWVVSAGNDCIDANLTAPASLEPEFPENLLVVASIDENKQLSRFSNAGTVTQVAAPGGFTSSGHSINSSIWKWCRRSLPLIGCREHSSDEINGRDQGFEIRNGYGEYPGTSMAAPMVTGVAALVQSHTPGLSAQRVKECIVGSSAERVAAISSFRSRFDDSNSDDRGAQASDLRLDQADYGHIVVVNALGAYLCEDQTQPTPAPTPVPPPAAEPGTSTALIMDVSSSMEEQTSDGDVKLPAAQAAADDVIETLQSEADLAGVPQEASVVAFSTDAELQHSSSTDLDSVREVVDTLSSYGDTNIGAGLDTAFEELVGRSTDQRLAILLSDGETNTGLTSDEILSQIVPSYADAGIPIYTIGFGVPGSYDEDLLRRIAEGTGGTYGYAESTQSLQEAFIRTRHEATGDIVTETEGTAAEGQTVDAASFDITGEEGLVNISLAAQTAGLDLVLVDPLGRPYDASQRNVQITDAEGLSTAFITSPLPGEWHLEVRGNDAAAADTSFYAIVSVRDRTAEQASVPVTKNERAAAAIYVAVSAALGLVLVLWAWRAVAVAGGPPRRSRRQRRHDG